MHRLIREPISASNSDAHHANAQYRKHVNGWVLVPNEALMSQGIDVTERLRTAAQSL